MNMSSWKEGHAYFQLLNDIFKQGDPQLHPAGNVQMFISACFLIRTFVRQHGDVALCVTGGHWKIADTQMEWLKKQKK